MEIRFSVKNLLTILVVAFLLYIVYSAIQTIVVTIFGFLLAYMLSPLAERISRRRIPYPLAAVFVLAFVMIIFAVLLFWLIPQIYYDLERLVKMLPAYLSMVMNYVADVGKFFDMDLSSSALYKSAMQTLSQSISTMVRGLAGMLGSLQSTVSATFNFIMIPVIACFVLVSYPSIQVFLDNYTGRVRKYISLSSEVLSSYFRGQFTVMAILCVLYTTALKVVGLDAAILLGVLTGLLSIVPYLGFAVGIVLSVLFAAMQFVDILHPLYVIIGYAIVQAIESFIVTPKIVGDSVGLHPAATIIVLLISGSVFGIAGMILALPITAIVFRLYKERVDGAGPGRAEREGK